MSMIRMDVLHGIFTAYEMRTIQESLSTKEVAFKASRRIKKNKNPESNPNCSYCDDSNEDEEVTNFVRSFKK
jgi:hypothetical protein